MYNDVKFCNFWSHGGFLSHGDTPSSHPFIDGFSMIHKPSSELGGTPLTLETSTCSLPGRPLGNCPGSKMIKGEHQDSWDLWMFITSKNGQHLTILIWYLECWKRFAYIACPSVMAILTRKIAFSTMVFAGVPSFFRQTYIGQSVHRYDTHHASAAPTGPKIGSLWPVILICGSPHWL